MRAGLLLALAALLAGPPGCASGDEGADFDVKVLYPVGGRGDRGFADSVFTGITIAKLIFDIDPLEVDPESVEEAEAVFGEWIASPPERAELIVVVGVPFASFVVARGCDFGEGPTDAPRRHILFLDAALSPCPAVKSVAYQTFVPSFQAGVAGVEVSRSKRLAVIAGTDLPTVDELIRGFRAGVEHAGGELVTVRYLADDVSGFGMPDAARALAVELYTDEALDVDVIFPVAGGSSVGVIDAAEQNPGQRFTFGIDTDQSIRGAAVVIASVLKRLDLTVEEAMEEMDDDEFIAGVFSVGPAEGGTQLSINQLFRDRVQGVVDASLAPATEAAIQDLRRRSR